LWAGSLVYAKSPSCPKANGTVEDPTYPLRKIAFESLAASDVDEARRLLHCAVEANPNDQIALAQLVYLDIDARQKTAAILDIQKLRLLHAHTRAMEMQLGYLYEEQKQLVPARMAFERAIEYNDPETTAQARKALAVIASEWPQHQFGVYFDSDYLSRFGDEVVDSDVRFYERLGWGSPVSFYVHGRVLRDTASHLGQLPQIFSDNAAIAGGGLFFQPYRARYFLSGEANEAYLFKQNSTGRTALVPDYRAIAGYFGSWPKMGGPFRFEANGSVGFYSRYQHDGIAYLQPREALDLFHAGGLRFSSFLQENVALDTNQAFYNNTAEVVPGLDIHARSLPGASLRFQYVFGYYLDLPGNSPNPYGPSYRDLRFRLLYGRNVSVGTP
jgi:tetratricopeptide (TPR) repeat protein